jgi:hypothetical protein
MTVHVGAQVERTPGPKYLAALHFFELKPAAPLPRPGSLARFRAEHPAPIAALAAPRPCIVGPRGPLRFDDTLTDAVGWLDAACGALAARFVVIETGSDVTTGARDRDLLAVYFDRVRADGRTIVWSPSGLWEPDTAGAFCAKHGLLYGCDPLETAPPPGATAYTRLTAIGGRRRFGDDSLDRVIEVLAPHAEAYVAIESERSFREAVRLQALVAQTATDEP